MRLLPLAVIVCLPAFASAPCDVTFTNVARYGLIEEPWSLVTADFDRDGRPDIAAMGDSSRAVSLLLSRGTGFVRGAPTALSHTATVLLGGGGSDLVAVGPAAISRIAGSTVTVTPVTGNALTNVAAVGDLNADAVADLAVIASSGSSRSLRIFLGTSDGTFAEKGSPAALAGSALDLEIADFSGDGKADIILADSRTGLVLDGNGDGTFRPSRPLHATLTNVRRIQVGDFDNDGRADVMAGTSLLLAADPATRRAVGFTGYAVDIDGDGKLDNFSMSEIYRGNGDGTFTLAAFMADEGPASRSAVFADFDGDSNIDVAAGTAWNDVAIHYGHGSLRFDGSSWGRGRTPYGGIAAGDFNGDGRADVASTSGIETNIYLAQPGGTIAYKTRLTAANAVAAGDFDEDGKVDLYLVGAGYVRGNGDGTFAEPAGGGGSSSSTVVTTTDLNGDRHLDIVYATGTDTTSGGSGTVVFLTNDGTGKFTKLEAASLPPLRAITAADFNRDGLADVVVAATVEYGPATLYLLDGRTPQTPVQIASNLQGETVKAADVDGDGFADVVAVSSPLDDLLIFPGNGNGTFRAPRRINVPDDANSGAGVTVADFDGDGRIDITVSTYQLLDVLVFIQQSDGSFVESAHLPSEWYGETVADVDGDGRPDLILDNDLSGWFRVALNRCRQELPLTQPVVRLTSNGPSGEGTAASFVAELDPAATGTVMFFEWVPDTDGFGQPTPIGMATVANGRATLTTTTLSRGTHEIHAVYQGEGSFTRSRSATIEHTVTAKPVGGKRRRSTRH